MNQGFSFEPEQEQTQTVTQTRRQRMTAEQAQTFEHESATSAATVAAQLACECEPYADVFTFNRWKAQGWSVRKGEKAQRVTGYVPKVERDATTGDEITHLIPRTNCVFCRCQVERTDEAQARRKAAKAASAARLDETTPATDN
jgi:hypothetical protein